MRKSECYIPDGPYVYALVDDQGRFFYIGKGRNRRMYQHRLNAVRGKPGERYDRIREVIARGNDISCVVLGEYVSDQDAGEAEKEFIVIYENLTNKTKGGEGSCIDRKEILRRNFRNLLEKMVLDESWCDERKKAHYDMIDYVKRQIEDPSPTWVKGHPNIPGSVTFGW